MRSESLVREFVSRTLGHVALAHGKKTPLCRSIPR